MKKQNPCIKKEWKKVKKSKIQNLNSSLPEFTKIMSGRNNQIIRAEMAVARRAYFQNKLIN